MMAVYTMSVRPIPHNMLIHTIEYEEFVKDSTFGEEFKPREVITHVLVQPAKGLRIETNDTNIDNRSTIFLDRTNTPKFKELKQRSKVYFRGEELRVVGCKSLYDFHPEIPHHYEVDVK